MRHQVAGKKLGRTGAHRNAMLRNMVTSLILNDRIETTLPKAKELKRWADKMITLAKRNSISARRQAMSVLTNRSALQKLFTILVDRYRDRSGGYTRVLKLGFRHGDNAAMAIVEYLTAEAKKVLKPAKKAPEAKAEKAALKREKGGTKKREARKAAAKPAKKKKETKTTSARKKAHKRGKSR